MGSWYQLYDIFREAEQFQIDAVSSPPTVCPLCGTTLSLGPAGERHCQFEGWVEGDTPVKWND